MKAIVDLIDTEYLAIYPDYKFWGLAEITDKGSDRFPVTVNGRDKVCVLDNYDCIVWHREISSDTSDNEDLSFGITIPTQFDVTLRTIVAYKIELGEEFKYEFIDNFPDLFPNGYQFYDSTIESINVDHESVVRDEFINVSYEKHRLCWNIFSFDTTISFVLCSETSP